MAEQIKIAIFTAGRSSPSSYPSGRRAHRERRGIQILVTRCPSPGISSKMWVPMIGAASSRTTPLSKGPRSPFDGTKRGGLVLRAEIDAICAHLYGLGREDVVKYGTYRTKEMILSHYDRYAGMVINAPEQG